MIHLIAGTQRSFTNAAVKIIAEASGLPVIKSRARDARFRESIDDESYKFNDGGLAEIEFCPTCSRSKIVALNAGRRFERDCDDVGCWSYYRTRPDALDGHVLKHHIAAPVWTLPEGDYRLLVLLRDYEETRQSWAAMGQNYSIPPEQHYLNVCGFFARAPVKHKVLAWAQDLFQESSLRRLDAWSRLAAMDWPIDPWKASDAVRPELNRFKRDGLDFGMPAVHPVDFTPPAWAGA